MTRITLVRVAIAIRTGSVVSSCPSKLEGRKKTPEGHPVLVTHPNCMSRIFSDRCARARPRNSGEVDFDSNSAVHACRGFSAMALPLVSNSNPIKDYSLQFHFNWRLGRTTVVARLAYEKERRVSPRHAAGFTISWQLQSRRPFWKRARGARAACLPPPSCSTGRVDDRWSTRSSPDPSYLWKRMDSPGLQVLHMWMRMKVVYVLSDHYCILSSFSNIYSSIFYFWTKSQ